MGGSGDTFEATTKGNNFKIGVDGNLQFSKKGDGSDTVSVAEKIGATRTKFMKILGNQKVADYLNNLWKTK